MTFLYIVVLAAVTTCVINGYIYLRTIIHHLVRLNAPIKAEKTPFHAWKSKRKDRP